MPGRIGPGDRVVIRGHGHRRTRLAGAPSPHADQTDAYGVVEHVGADGRTLVVLTADGPVEAPAAGVDPLTIDAVELRLSGHDLVESAEFRRGLLAMWAAEVRHAGLEPGNAHPLGDGVRDSSEGYVLAETVVHGHQFVVRAERWFDGSGLVCVRVERPNRWDG